MGFWDIVSKISTPGAIYNLGKAVYKGYKTPGGYLGPKAYAAEDNRPQWQKEGFRDEDEWLVNNGYPTAGAAGEYDPGLLANEQGTTIQDQRDAEAAAAAEAASAGGGGEGIAEAPAEAPYVPDIIYLNGIAYDLNNESERAAFYQVKSAEIDKNLTQALQSGNLKYAAELAGIQDQMTQYMHDWTAQGEELGKGYSQGMTARQQFFQGLGTRAYQSAMGTSGQQALNKLGEAQTERNYQKGIQEAQTKKATSGLEQAFNEWQTGAGQQAQGLKDELRGTVTAIGGFNNAPAQAPIVSQADLSAYTPYLNFQALAGSPLVTQQKTVTKPVSQMTLSEWLQNYAGKSTNPLQDYLQGKTT